MTNVDYRFNKLRQIHINLEQKQKELDLVQDRINLFIEKLSKFKKVEEKKGELIYMGDRRKPSNRDCI